MELCNKLGYERVQLKGDMQVLINCINGEDAYWSWHGNLIEDVKQALKNRSLWSINFFHREENQVAHLLAKNGLSLPTESISIEKSPSVINHIIPAESSNQ